MKTSRKSLACERAGTGDPTAFVLLAVLGLLYYLVMLALALSGAPVMAF